MTVLRDYASLMAEPTLDSAGAHGFDEVLGPDGLLRPAWKALAESATRLTPLDLQRVVDAVDRQLTDDGVTFQRPGESASRWRLDPMPLILDAETWAPLQAGLAQRAELLNEIVRDLYGPQNLLAERVIPASVIFGHSGYIRPVVRPSERGPRPLVMTATDVGRDAEGRWRVVADRTQAPSGIGYAMENRKVIAKVLPELYREAGIHRIEPYFWALRSSLIASAEGDRSDPRVVVLSPGAMSETAYDQAFLANTLGFPLVQGKDLMVRDGAVYLRPQSGRNTNLERVDVIWRRVDATWADPLELRGDSQLGIAGLAEVARRGGVRVVNGLGSGVLENPGLMPFMEQMCQRLLGESLRLPTVPTWWCGDPDSRREVLSRLGEVIIRSIDASAGELDALEPEQLRATVEQAPYRFVAQQRLPLSKAPVWRPDPTHRDASGAARPAPIMLRAFTVRYGSAYRPLIGGLASVVENGRSVASKDVWVIKEGPSDLDQGLSGVLPVAIASSVVSTPPRVSENMYWAGRYAERAEGMLRLVLAARVLAEEFRSRPSSHGEDSLEAIMGAVFRLAGQAREATDLDDEFRSLLLDRNRVGSAAQALAAMRESLAAVRDQLSLDVWRAFGTTDRAAIALRESPYASQIDDSAGQMLSGTLSLQGVTASMVRDPGWHMMGVGRALERAIQVAHLLTATATIRRGFEVDRDVHGALLTATESAVTHRRRYRGSARPGGVVELLVLDRGNPRSIAFNLDELTHHLAKLPDATGSSRPERLLDDLRTEVLDAEVAGLVTIGGIGRPNLERYLASIIAQLYRIADAIAELHFASGPPPRPIGALHIVETLEAMEP